MFQCSSASRKFLNRRTKVAGAALAVVSVLFSEPKIPQFVSVIALAIGVTLFQCSSASRKFLNRSATRRRTAPGARFSALQRAENSSIRHAPAVWRRYVLFQCSSASRKFLNSDDLIIALRVMEFQCSSASRKFLNDRTSPNRRGYSISFSALQRAENSSISPEHRPSAGPAGFSALQRAENSSIYI